MQVNQWWTFNTKAARLRSAVSTHSITRHPRVTSFNSTQDSSANLSIDSSPRLMEILRYLNSLSWQASLMTILSITTMQADLPLILRCWAKLISRRVRRRCQGIYPKLTLSKAWAQHNQLWTHPRKLTDLCKDLISTTLLTTVKVLPRCRSQGAHGLTSHPWKSTSSTLGTKFRASKSLTKASTLRGSLNTMKTQLSIGCCSQMSMKASCKLILEVTMRSSIWGWLSTELALSRKT